MLFSAKIQNFILLAKESDRFKCQSLIFLAFFFFVTVIIYIFAKAKPVFRGQGGPKNLNGILRK